MSYRERPPRAVIESRALALFRRFDTAVDRLLVPMVLVSFLEVHVGIAMTAILLLRAVGHMHFGFQVVGLTTADCLKQVVRCLKRAR